MNHSDDEREGNGDRPQNKGEMKKVSGKTLIFSSALAFQIIGSIKIKTPNAATMS